MFDKYLFHCSALGNLMTESRSKNDPLSETTKKFLKEIYIEEVFGRKKEISNKYTEKGSLVEQDSLSLITKKYNKFFIENKDPIKNSYIVGTPDIITRGLIIDAKSSWDIWTFASANGKNKAYIYQGLGYMWLTKKKNFDLAYCLVNTPDHLIVSEKIRQQYAQGLTDGTEEMAKMEMEIEKNMIFDDIPEELRIKVFHFEYDKEAINKLKQRIKEARIYLNSLSL